MTTPRSGVVEPVHWGSRLVRSDDVRYTEVAGSPVLVGRGTGDVRVLTTAWAALWAQLDGRPLTDALAVTLDGLSATDARNLIEILRRLKADGAIRDAGPNEPLRTADDLIRPGAQAHPVEVTFTGACTTKAGSRTLRITPRPPTPVTVHLVERAGEVLVTHRRRVRRRRVDRVVVTDPTTSREIDDPVEAFAAIVRALTDRDVLAGAATVDLLAGLAERATRPGSPPARS